MRNRLDWSFGNLVPRNPGGRRPGGLFCHLCVSSTSDGMSTACQSGSERASNGVIRERWVAEHGYERAFHAGIEAPCEVKEGGSVIACLWSCRRSRDHRPCEERLLLHARVELLRQSSCLSSLSPPFLVLPFIIAVIPVFIHGTGTSIQLVWAVWFLSTASNHLGGMQAAFGTLGIVGDDHSTALGMMGLCTRARREGVERRA